MSAIFFMTLEKMLRILLLLLLGFCLRRWNVISASASAVMSQLVTFLFLPALSLYSNMVECKVSSLTTYSRWVIYGAVLGVISAIGATILAPLFTNDSYLQGIYRYALAVPNTGAVATPLVLAFFGTSGLFQFSLFQFFIIMITYTWGVAQLLPNKERPSLTDRLRKCINPMSIAMVSGILLGLAGATEWMPPAVIETVDSLGGCYLVISLLACGASIAEYPLSMMLGNKKTYLYALFRLIVIPAVFLSALVAIGAPHMVCIMATFCYTSPCGMNVIVYPAAYGKDCSTGVGMVLLSSIGSVFTVPLMYALVQTIHA